MKHTAFSAISFFLLVSQAQALPCATVKEARAEALIGFLTYQYLAAGLCEKIPTWRGTVVLEIRMRSKIKAQIDEANRLRERLYRRRYGKKWKGNITRIEKRFTEILLRRIRPNYDMCFDLQSELSRQIAEGWAYLSHKVDLAYWRARANPEVKICKRV